ncbi:MAG: glycerol-3-phosphate 1-O-acyltransferase PlsY [Candidatus Omnitrophica bacterium]|nr:glycerol-3-phosphate 1-O-acyltransferase PlsY [Candidatus Omnitrophota bacterium]MDD5565831.1 glycerol-3-phosphate 1-O-acyltransferase PlsY [Candidatus Omnitrophota bacterium]
MAQILLRTVISYLVGSFPTAYIFGKLLKGVDIRRVGSGNVGATNAFRVLGKGPGIAVLCIDILKGFIAVVFLGNSSGQLDTVISPQLLGIILGLACIIGHNWPVFLRFKGGKGVATTLGVLLALACTIASLKIILLSLFLTWSAVFLFFRIVSLASIVTAIMLPVYAYVFKQPAPIITVSILLALLSIARHHSNISKLLQGKEQRLF